MEEDREALEAQLLSVSARLLGKVAGKGFTVRVTGRQRDFAFRCDEGEISSGDKVAQVGRQSSTNNLFDAALRILFSHEQRTILEALGDREMSGADLAQKAHMDYETRFKTMLSVLKDRGVLAPGARGYRIADPTVLELFKLSKSLCATLSP